MNALETKLVEMAAVFWISPDQLDTLEAAVDEEFSFLIKTAKDWGYVSEIPDTVLDVAVRSAKIDWVASRGPRINKPASTSISFGKLVRAALNAAQRYSTAAPNMRGMIRGELQTVYLSIGDFVRQEWIESRKRV